jgi:hypothetical protein
MYLLGWKKVEQNANAGASNLSVWVQRLKQTMSDALNSVPLTHLARTTSRSCTWVPFSTWSRIGIGIDVGFYVLCCTYDVWPTMLRTVPSISARVRAWFSVFCVRLVLASRKFKLLDHSRRFVSVMWRVGSMTAWPLPRYCTTLPTTLNISITSYKSQV